MNENKGILLESGTNEFEIVEFTVGNVAYGVNVAKVREIIKAVPATKIVGSHPWVDGLFVLRNRSIPLVCLGKCLENKPIDKPDHKIIVCEINNVYTGFKVEDVARIHRVSWTQMEPPPLVADSMLTVGIVKFPDRLIWRHGGDMVRRQETWERHGERHGDGSFVLTKISFPVYPGEG